MKRIALIIGFLAGFASNAMAVVNVHGGSAVVCETPAGKIAAESFDRFEGRETGTLDPDLGPAALPYEQKVARFLDRVETRDANRAKAYREAFALFRASSAFMNRAAIKDISNSREVITAKGDCYKIQSAVQRLKVKEFEKKFLVDNEIWTAMDSDSKAMTVLHELISFDEINHGIETEEGVRLYNEVMSSANGDTMDRKTYATLVAQNLAPQQIVYRLFGVLVGYAPSLGETQGILMEPYEVAIPQGKLACALGAVIAFDASGGFQKCGGTRVIFSAPEQQALFGRCSAPTFYPSGMVKDCDTGGKGVVSLPAMQASYNCTGRIAVDEKGTPASCTSGAFTTDIVVQGFPAKKAVTIGRDARFTSRGSYIGKIRLVGSFLHDLNTVDGKSVTVATMSWKCRKDYDPVCSSIATIGLDEAGLVNFASEDRFTEGRYTETKILYPQK